jgi:hypothetical protein
MFEKSIRLQYSLRTVGFLLAVAAIPLCWFAPQLRAAMERYLQSGQVVPFHTASAAGNNRTWSSFDAMHEFYIQRFVESEGFGFSRILRMDEPMYRQLVVNGQPYTARRMELVSLNGGDEPFAYVNGIGNPRKDSLTRSERRNLSEFEQAAVQAIAQGRTAVFNGDQARPLVVGAIRARKSCLECHSAKPDELLGCMTYELQPALSTNDFLEVSWQSIQNLR